MSSSAFVQILETWKISELEITMFWASTPEKAAPVHFFLHKGSIVEVDTGGVQVELPAVEGTPPARAFVSLKGAKPEGDPDPRHVRFRFPSGAIVDFMLVG